MRVYKIADCYRKATIRRTFLALEGKSDVGRRTVRGGAGVGAILT